MKKPYYQLKIKASFCAAHHIRGYPGKCERVHGHNYKIEAEVGSSELNEQGLCIDYFIVNQQLQELIQQLDHYDLNEISPFDQINPSAENIAKWFYQKLQTQLKKESYPVNLIAVNLWETDDFCVRYTES